jgi:hypothetical protein
MQKMKTFKINEEIEIVCEHQNTRSGFRHVATLLINESEVDKAKICYLNRTWEQYEFESVLRRIVDRTIFLSDEQKKICNKFIEGDRTDYSMFKTTATVAMLGEIFGKTKKESNDWKVRMLKAGIRGIEIPDDWETLSEDTKEIRLNKIIEMSKNLNNE